MNRGFKSAQTAGGSTRMRLRSIYHREPGSWPAIILAVAVRDIDRRFRRSSLSGLLFALEPLLLLVIVATLQFYVRNGVPVYGQSNVLFLATGFFPFYLFVHCSRGLSRNLANDREFPIINDLDLQIALIIIEVGRSILLASLVFIALYVYGISEAMPSSLDPLLFGGALVTMLAAGLGLFNSGLISVFPTWAFMYPPLSRMLLFGSGVYNVVDYFPPQIRVVVGWNPLAHCLMLFRTGFYPEYPQASLDRQYVAQVAVLVLAFGFMAFSARIRQH